MSEQLRKAAAWLADQVDPDARVFAPPMPFAPLVAAAVSQMCWGAMNYRCEVCGFEWEVWLGLGVEGPPGLREAGLYVPCAFTVGCPAWPLKPDATVEEIKQLRNMGPCSGSMAHTDWQRDRHFEPMLPPDDAPRFVLDAQLDQGRLVLPADALVRARRFHREK
jgi:hypothetical protein